jgi:DNA-binding MarR family transcriptional regulator
VTRRREPTEFIETLAAVKRCLSALAGQTYASVDIGTTQAKFLRAIGQHGRMSQAELARATGTDPTLTGRVLQPLIERGLVRRQRSDADRRQYVLELGAAGRRAQRRVEQLRAQLAARVVAALDRRDLDDFDRLAQKILAAFQTSAERG